MDFHNRDRMFLETYLDKPTVYYITTVTPKSRILLEKLKEIPLPYGSQWIITMFSKAHR
jgi:hypothetical protein